MATNSSTQIWKIEHPCPQCGAQVLLEETDRIFRCEYCRNRLYIAPRAHFQYFLSPREPASDLIFLPYWRFRGLMFSFDALNVSSRIIDTSLLALDRCPAPMSLGMRPQALKLRYVTPEISGTFLKPGFPFKRFLHTNPALPDLQCIEKQPARNSMAGIEPSFIGETESLIYSPVSIRGNVLFDEILQAPFGKEYGTLSEISAQSGHSEPENQLTLLPTMCPTCGWDMEGEKNSLVLFCRNCATAWRCLEAGINGPSFEGVRFTFQPASNGAESEFYLPFWDIDSTVGGLALRSYADLARLANLPTAILEKWESKKLHFWIPAFKIQPNLFIRLSRTITTFQPDIEENRRMPKSGISPVTLPLTEALETIKVLIASMAVPKQFIFPLLPNLSFSMNDHTLVYLRFIQRGQEFIQEDFSISIQASAVTWGQFI